LKRAFKALNTLLKEFIEDSSRINIRRQRFLKVGADPRMMKMMMPLGHSYGAFIDRSIRSLN